MAKCKFCESEEHYKNGIVRGHQRYKCKDCGRNFTQTAIRGVCSKDKLKALMLYASGLSMNRIAQLFGVSTVAVLKWIRTLGSTLCPKIEPSGDEQVLVMEVDEFWHFLKKKKNKLWIFKAYDRHRQRLIDWEIGDRSHQTFKRLYERLKKFNPLFYCSDHWAGFNKIIPSNRLFQEKDKTYRIEQNNSRQRHWFARFRRRTVTVSRSLQMVDITIAIFAAVHVNKTLKFNDAIFS